jgi:hypothetical protein
MSVRRRAGTVFAICWTILLLPARVIEEGLHALAALPWAEAVSVRLDPGAGTAETAVQYRAGTPQWAVWLAHVAPEAAAAAAGLATIVWWLVGGGVWWPASLVDWILLWLCGVQWLAIAMPEQGGVR